MNNECEIPCIVIWRIAQGKFEETQQLSFTWMKVNTSTCPTGVRGIINMIVKGIRVSRSLPVLRTAFTSL